MYIIMKRFPNNLLALTAMVGITLSACNNSSTSNQTTSDTASHTPTMPQTAMGISPVTNSPEFPEASLSIKSITAEPLGTDSAKVTIQYDVAHYELKHQTQDAGDKACNNSKDGQHIHFILDNQPYVALYEPTRTFNVATNSEHYLMSFLSRSYHESIKSPKAGVLYRFKIDGKGKLSKLDIPKQPMIFYSRPKGDYIGNDTKNVLLDFYVYNATLAADGYKVKANINDTTLLIDHWQPYFIQNAPLGGLKVQLTLVDKEGNPVQGENTSASRNVNLAAQEPIQ
jgi:hypothetical protein